MFLYIIHTTYTHIYVYMENYAINLRECKRGYMGGVAEKNRKQ